MLGQNRRAEAPFDGDYEKAVEWCQGQNGEDYGSSHAAMIDLLFAPPEDYGDPWMERIWDVAVFVRNQPCLCTPEMLEDHQPCERCRLLNIDGAGR